MTNNVPELVRALQELHQRFRCDEVTVTYQVPGPGEHLITLALCGGELLTFSDDQGNVQAMTLRELLSA